MIWNYADGAALTKQIPAPGNCFDTDADDPCQCRRGIEDLAKRRLNNYKFLTSLRGHVYFGIVLLDSPIVICCCF